MIASVSAAAGRLIFKLKKGMTFKWAGQLKRSHLKSAGVQLPGKIR